MGVGCAGREGAPEPEAPGVNAPPPGTYAVAVSIAKDSCHLPLEPRRSVFVAVVNDRQGAFRANLPTALDARASAGEELASRTTMTEGTPVQLVERPLPTCAGAKRTRVLRLGGVRDGHFDLDVADTWTIPSDDPRTCELPKEAPAASCDVVTRYAFDVTSACVAPCKEVFASCVCPR